MVGAHMIQNEKSDIYIPNGVDFSRATASLETSQQLRSRLNVADNQILILLFGWSPYIKGVDIAAHAIARLQEKGFLLCIVCGREMTEEKMKAWLLEHDCRLNALRLLPPSADVFSYHHAADIMLSASRTETFSYTLAEALYAKTPCVISDIPGTSWAASYDTVCSFSSGDDTACAETLIKAAAGFSPEAFTRAQQRIINDCAIEQWVSRVISVYQAF